ncbi:MAG: FAD-dependent oxidoreductase [Candidatus Kariarchaeaceae archaeon]|jgi:hypothetical protein
MRKIAIIGAGVGGSSLAYYLKDVEDIDVTIFEARDVVGGRVRNTEMEELLIETGGSFFHAANRNLIELLDQLEIQKEEVLSDTFGLWDGKKMIFQTRKSSLLTNLILLFRFGFNLLKLQNAIKQVKENISSFYESDITFETIPEMIALLNCRNLFSNDIEKNLTEMGVKEKIISNLAIPSSRYIYHQCGTRSMNGFAGFVSLIASDGEPIYRLSNGNKTICEKLISKSRAALNLSTKIKSIRKVESGYELDFDGKTEEYDFVIIFTPLEISGIELLDMSGIKEKLSEPRKYVPYVKTIVAGEIKPSYFALKSIPDMILTTENSTAPMKGMSRMEKSPKNQSIWTLSSDEGVERKILDEMFENIRDVKEVSVSYTYPELDKLDLNAFDPIILNENLYYGNPIDTLSPTMESSIIVAKNFSRLIRKLKSVSPNYLN